ncbi:MAG TPA: hypothetical protein VEW74_04150, partial [Candidatus Nitrosotalea sp.]|nr:hypothetical protein [Candidatus Nitrosotalea sp.]
MRKRLAIGLLAAVILLSLAVATRHALLRFLFEEGAGIATGYTVRAAELHVGWTGAAIGGLTVERASLPLLAVANIAVRYSLRDLFPGSRHRFGLLRIEVDGAKLTLTRFRDGSFNLVLPRGAPPEGPQRVNGVPLKLDVRVRDASIELREPAAYDETARDVRADGITADAAIDSAAVTAYRLRGAFEERRREPFTIAGRIDAIAGFAMHHAHASYFPMRALANYLADTPAVRILGGEAKNLDARVYALGVTPDSAPSYHASLGLDVVNGRLAMQSLDAPVVNMRAHLQVVDNAFFVRDAHAELAGIPLTITGGMYDFTGGLTGRAELRLGVWGEGNLSALRRAFAFARDQPISGPARLGVLVHGAIDDPVIVARVTAPHAYYRALPFQALYASVVYHSNVVALAPLRVSYSGIAVHVNGTLGIGPHVHSEFALHVEGPASHLPYLDEMLGDEPLAIDASATGNDLLFHVAGSAASLRGVERVAALVDTNPNGTVAVEPFWFHTERGDFDGGYLLDRPHNTSAFWMLASGLRMHPAKYAAFPGITLPQIPPIEARSMGMSLAGGGDGN